jgi:hypothetical protein
MTRVALALTVLFATFTGGCVTHRIDEHTKEIHGIDAFVDLRAPHACGRHTSPISVTEVSYEPSRTTTGSMSSTLSTTGSCDRSGTCLTTTSTTTSPITWTRAARSRVRVTCPAEE